MGEQPAQHNALRHPMSYHTDSTFCCTGPSLLPSPGCPAVALFTVVVGDVRPPLGLVTVLGAGPGQLSKSRFQGRALEGRSCEVTGPFPSVGSALSSPSLHAYLAGQISFARASKPRHTSFPGPRCSQPGLGRSAMLPLEPARPPVTALSSQPGGTAVWSSHHSWHAAIPKSAVPCSCRSLG